jgi:betaine-aldehyde dehydrogenase
MSQFQLPDRRDLFYGGAWHRPTGDTAVTVSPSTGQELGSFAVAGAEDVDRAVAAARDGFAQWRRVAPLERARVLREMARRLAARRDELAWIDAIDGGSPVRELRNDVDTAVAQLDFFAGLVTEMKGASVPMGPGVVNFSVREPLGVVVRIIPFNHPFMFCAGKPASALAAGNAVIVKPPEQAPLSALRIAELAGDLFPPGVLSVVTGDGATGAALASHPGVAKVALIGSVNAGRAVMRAGADHIRPVLLELGGKNALIAFADADPGVVARAAVAGMNFGWCGQSCGSTSRAFLHDAIHDEVLDRLADELKQFRPGPPEDPATSMGALVSRDHRDRVLGYITRGQAEGARLVAGGGPPPDPGLAGGCFIEPTVFANVTQDMTIAREEIFGPVLSVLRWDDPRAMLADVNSTPYGLTCSIWTNDLAVAHETAAEAEAGYVWVNEVARHFLGTAFGGYKQSGIGREECLDELLDFTQQKNIHIRYRPG